MTVDTLEEAVVAESVHDKEDHSVNVLVVVYVI
jgi:hypothetical protein